MTARGLSLRHNSTGCVDPGGQKDTVMTGEPAPTSTLAAPALLCRPEPRTGGTTYLTVDLEDAATVALDL